MFLTTLCEAEETSVVKSTKAQVAVTHTENTQWPLDERDQPIDLSVIQTKTSTSSTHNELVPSKSWSVDYQCLMVLLFEIDAASSAVTPVRWKLRGLVVENNGSLLMDPGNHSWTPEALSRLVFPGQMLSEGFWVATHLTLHNPSSLTSEQLWVTSTAVRVDMR